MGAGLTLGAGLYFVALQMREEPEGSQALQIALGVWGAMARAASFKWPVLVPVKDAEGDTYFEQGSEWYGGQLVDSRV